ncbi:hypothetical protein ABPG74_019307 [Tetrahymena malaccensis]
MVFKRVQKNFIIIRDQNYLHVWGDVSLSGKTILNIYNGTVNSESYQECLGPTFLPSNKIHQNKLILLQDGAKSHTSQSTKKILLLKGFNIFEILPTLLT